MDSAFEETVSDDELKIIQAIHDYPALHGSQPSMARLTKYLELPSAYGLGRTVRGLVERGCVELAGRRPAPRLTGRGLNVLARAMTATQRQPEAAPAGATATPTTMLPVEHVKRWVYPGQTVGASRYRTDFWNWDGRQFRVPEERIEDVG